MLRKINMYTAGNPQMTAIVLLFIRRGNTFTILQLTNCIAVIAQFEKHKYTHALKIDVQKLYLFIVWQNFLNQS